jgi:AcrR family transcriptional regulator
MKKGKQTKGEVTRLTIEDAAIGLFLEQGYHATSMRQIAERADLASVAGIYNHFSSKDEIFEGIIIDKHPYKQILPAILAAHGETIEEFFTNAFHIVISELDKRPEFINLLFIELVEFKGNHGSLLLKEVAPKVLPMFEKLIKSRKSLRVTNPAVLMRSFVGMIMSYYVTGVIISNSIVGKLMPQDIVDQYIDIFLHGILKGDA